MSSDRSNGYILSQNEHLFTVCGLVRSIFSQSILTSAIATYIYSRELTDTELSNFTEEMATMTFLLSSIIFHLGYCILPLQYVQK